MAGKKRSVREEERYTREFTTLIVAGVMGENQIGL